MPGAPRTSFPGSASSTYGHAGHGLLAQSLHTHSLHSHSLHSHSGASSNDMLYGGALQPRLRLLQGGLPAWASASHLASTALCLCEAWRLCLASVSCVPALELPGNAR